MPKKSAKDEPNPPNKNNVDTSSENSPAPHEVRKPTCGIVMPIGEIDGCPESHWGDVLDIIKQAVEAAGFECDLVSESDDVGIIQGHIVQNLYDNDIIVADVSAKNPNVMFELGMRLAFNKPAIVIKDDVTKYSFDTSPINHLGYPRDLRYQLIEVFKKQLEQKVLSTHNSFENNTHKSFLDHFGKFNIANLPEKDGSLVEYFDQKFEGIGKMIARFGRKQRLHEERKRAIRQLGLHGFNEADPFQGECSLTGFAAGLAGGVNRDAPIDIQVSELHSLLSDNGLTLTNPASDFETFQFLREVIDETA